MIEEIIQEEVTEQYEEVIQEETKSEENKKPEAEVKITNQEVKKNRIIKTKSSDFGNIVLKPK